MSKEDSLKSLFGALKVSLKNASFYHKEHPAFTKSVEDLKEKIDNLMDIVTPIKIGFTPNAVFFDNKYWEEDKAFRELARIFHFRKVKSLEIKKGLDIQELTSFIANFHLPPKEIYKEGGLQNILKQEKIFHLSVEELNYSQLLIGDGEEVKDVWTYLLDDAITKQDTQQMEQVAESFEKIAGQLAPEDFDENEELNMNVNKLMNYMKKAQEDRFHSCAKVLVKAFVKNKKLAHESKVEKLQIIFADIGEEDFASALWEEIATDTSFDALSFNIFSKLVEKDKQDRIAAKLKEEAQKDDSLETSKELRNKIKELLSGTSSPYVSEIYRVTLASLLQEIDIKKELQLDRLQLIKNYRYTLLNLFVAEADVERKKNLLTHILEEWEEIRESEDFEFLKNLAQTLKQENGDFSFETIAIKTHKLITDYVEKAVLRGQSSPYFDFFMERMEQSALSVNDYLQRVFSEGKITPFILQFFFKFFSDSIMYFLISLEERSSDNHFLERMTESVKLIDSPLSLEILKTIYPLVNNTVKTKVLRAIQQLSVHEEKFLMPILQKGSFTHKKEALIILVKHEETRKKALDALFSLPSPFGLKNKIIRRNIQLVGDACIQEARDHIFALSKKKGLWHRKVRKEARKALEKLDG
ncbi:MAG: hypothetical protein JSV17_17805 [Candidatus Aminicenantes bacterium]|nr:MAG: hypothetical protein JSV17_17805 [Candidatus Aminicenantes bacterium]